METPLVDDVRRTISEHCSQHGDYPEEIWIAPGTALRFILEIQELNNLSVDLYQKCRQVAMGGEQGCVEYINSGLRFQGVKIKAAEWKH